MRNGLEAGDSGDSVRRLRICPSPCNPSAGGQLSPAGRGRVTFQDELQAVLAAEREGKERLAEATAEAERIVGRYRQQARDLTRQAQAAQETERRERMAREEAELAALVAGIEERTRIESERLQTLAARNRERAVRRVLDWLWARGGERE
jgi:hypothetical protein